MHFKGALLAISLGHMTLRLVTVRSTGHMTSRKVQFLIKPLQSIVVRGSLHVSESS